MLPSTFCMRPDASRPFRLLLGHPKQKPPWNSQPAPLPAPQDVRRAPSSFLLPDPDERLRDKLARSRRAAAGVLDTAWAIRGRVRGCNLGPKHFSQLTSTSSLQSCTKGYKWRCGAHASYVKRLCTLCLRGIFERTWPCSCAKCTFAVSSRRVYDSLVLPLRLTQQPRSCVRHKPSSAPTGQ